MKNNKGITLIAIVITIIVLLILTIVSIKLFINTGIIAKSEIAVNEYSQSEINEKAKLILTSARIINNGGAITFDSLKTAADAEGISYIENDEESISCSINGKSVIIDIYENITIGEKTINWSIDDVGIIELVNKGDITDIKRIIIPGKIGSQTVTGIKEEAFSGTAIEYVSIPKTVNNIGAKAFYNCTSLTEIQMPGDINMTSDTFSGCAGISKVTLTTSASSTKIATRGDTDKQRMPWFKTNTDVEIIITEGITEIGEAAFADAGVDNINHISMVTIPSTISIFGNYSFSSCANLRTLNITDGLKSINNGTLFFDCIALEEVVIPSSVTQIVNGLFGGCLNLKDIYFKGNAPADWISGCSAKINENYLG